MNRQRFAKLESGQGVTEYALLTILAGIAAIGILTLLGGSNFREGVLYEGIYRPVQCTVQGISQENCSAARYVGIRFPTVYENDTNSRKLCNTYDNDGNNLWANATNCDSATDDGSGPPVAPMSVNRMVLQSTDFIYQFDTDNTEELQVVAGDYEAIVARGDIRNPGYSGSVESMSFSISPAVETADGNGTISSNIDSVDGSVPSVNDNGVTTSADYTLNERNNVVLVAGQSYTVTATPYSGNDATGTAGTPLTINITVIEPDLAPPIIQGILFEGDSIIFSAGSNNNELIAGEYTPRFQFTNTVENVRFGLTGTGPTTVGTTTHTNAPFYLFDTGTGNVGTPATFEEGNYTLTATPFDVNNNPGDQITITFSVIPDPAANLQLSHFNLIDADTDDVEEAQIADDATLTLAQDTRFSFQAVPANSPNTITEVTMNLSGPRTANTTEGNPPYAMFGDSNGDYNGETLPAGDYTLQATATDGNITTEPLIINFTVEEPAQNTGPQVTGFFLRRAVSGSQDTLEELVDGGQVDENQLYVDYNSGEGFIWNVSIRTDRPDSDIDRVEFELSGDENRVVNPERNAPYVFPGDQNDIDLEPGSYTLTATVFVPGEDAGVGSVDFEVIDSSPICTDRSIAQVTVPFCDNDRVIVYVDLACDPGDDQRYTTTDMVTSSVTINGVNNTADVGEVGNASTRLQFDIEKTNDDLGLNDDRPNYNYNRICQNPFQYNPMDLSINWPNGEIVEYELDLGALSVTEN